MVGKQTNCRGSRDRQGRARRAAMTAAVGGVLLLGASSLVGCRTSSDDVERWASTAQGPSKLIAVLTHDKYPLELRVESALTLVRMKPRSGRRVGIEELLSALGDLAPAERGKLMAQLVPQLLAEMMKPLPKAQKGQPHALDPSYPYKDAAFALLTTGDGGLVTDDGLRVQIRKALSDWVIADFADRMDESTQMYGVEQVLRALGTEGVARLPDLMVPSAKKVDRMASLVAELGDDATKQRASAQLVAIAKEVDSQHWVDQTKPGVEAANERSKLHPTPEQLKAQLEQYQEEELLRVFGSLKRVGGDAARQYLVAYAQNKDNALKRRVASLAALEGHLDKNNAKDLEVIFGLASAADTPDDLRDIALLRIGELPRAVAVERLYALFDNENWKIRWVAADLLLKMSDTSHIAEFMTKLCRVRNQSLAEPTQYGLRMSEMKGKPQAAIDGYLASGHCVQDRLVALGYYFAAGNSAQLSKVAPYENDREKTPKCKDDAQGCEWKCVVGEGKDQQVKDVTTVGEFVQYCVEPAMKKRAPDAKAPTK